MELLNACLRASPVQLDLFDNACIVLVRLGNVLDALVLVRCLQLYGRH